MDQIICTEHKTNEKALEKIGEERKVPDTHNNLSSI